MSVNYQIITSSEALISLCSKLKNKDLIALDTEFVRVDTFYSCAGLIQLNDGEQVYLIDPVAIDDLTPLADVFVADIIVIMHSCSEDIELLERLTGVVPKYLFDTQIAMALLGKAFSLSYQSLVELYCDITIDKGETRSDWTKRPLTESQLHYAALDVEYLITIARQLIEELNGLERLAWLFEETQTLIAKIQSDAPYYSKVKSAWKLNTDQLKRLNRVIEWREHRARQQNVPRGRVIKDEHCLNLVLAAPETAHELADIQGIGGATIRKYGEQLLGLLHTPNPELDDNIRRLPKPLPKHSRDLVKHLKSTSKAIAERQNIAPELLVRKKDIEFLVRCWLNKEFYVLPESLSGWRKSVVGNELLSIVESYQ